MSLNLSLKRAELNPTYLPLIELIAGKVDEYLPYPFNEELKGKLNLYVKDFLKINFLYSTVFN